VTAVIDPPNRTGDSGGTPMARAIWNDQVLAESDQTVMVED